MIPAEYAIWFAAAAVLTGTACLVAGILACLEPELMFFDPTFGKRLLLALSGFSVGVACYWLAGVAMGG